jgi:hypothetical protein
MPWITPPPPVNVSKADIARITKAVKKEFPGDWALQQVHMARKIIYREAALAGMDVWEYHRYLSKRRKWIEDKK